MEEGNDWAFDDRKKHLKKRAFEIVADQTGKFLIRMYLLLFGQEDLQDIKEQD